MDDFIDVYSRRDGRKYRKPAHYKDNPRLMAPFRLTPSTRGGSRQQPVDAGTVIAETGGDTSTPTAAPDPADAD
jgi:hypothetical protein